MCLSLVVTNNTYIDEEEGNRALFLGLGERNESECDDFWEMWFKADRAIKQIRRWFEQKDKLPAMNLRTVDWMTAAS